MAPSPAARLRKVFGTALYNGLVLTCRFNGRRWYRSAWRSLWSFGERNLAVPVPTMVHGHRVIVDFGYTYPVNARLYPNYNDPLVHLVRRCHSAAGRPLWVVDVGAAIGDTVLLLEANCHGCVEKIISVEGDERFFALLCANLRGTATVQPVRALLSAGLDYEPSLVRIHPGTASAQGEARTPATTLDAVLSELAPPALDVLKIDVDGFDGKVLAGSVETLERFAPAVIFEWHPRLCHATGSAPFEAFAALRKCGYDTLVWFTKFGTFSHFSAVGDGAAAALLERYCVTEEVDGDWHYDIVALPAASQIDAVALARGLPAGAKSSSH